MTEFDKKKNKFLKERKKAVKHEGPMFTYKVMVPDCHEPNGYLVVYEGCVRKAALHVVKNEKRNDGCALRVSLVSRPLSFRNIVYLPN